MTGTRSCCGGPAWPRTRRPAIRREPLDPAGRRGSRPCGAPPLAPSLQFAEDLRKGPAGSLMNHLSSHRIVRECSEYRCKGFRRVSGVNLILPPPVLGSSATADGWTPEPAPLPSQIPLPGNERMPFILPIRNVGDGLRVRVDVPRRCARSLRGRLGQSGSPRRGGADCVEFSGFR